MVSDLRKQGMSDTQIAKALNAKIQEINPDTPEFNTTKLRASTSIARNKQRAANIAMAEGLKAKGLSNIAIAERMRLPGESSVRALLEPGAKIRTDQLQATAAMLKDQVARKGYVDVGVGVERYSGTSRTKFDTALSMLESQGYHVIKVQVDQQGTGNKTTIKVLAPPGMTRQEHYKHLVQNLDQIQPIDAASKDGIHYEKIKPPVSISSKRVAVRYAEQGGTDADGVMYLRPGVKDLDMGGSNYAQVRIAVDGTHYLKGMAVYKDDLPEGVDIMFNTNKHDTGNKLDAMKPMQTKKNPDGSISIDHENPFGAAIKPLNGQRGVLNIVNEEGDWGEWSKSLASQFLSKQKPTLAEEQLGKLYSNKKKDLDEITALTNPAVKRKLLQSYSDDIDSASVHLKAAALPRQATQVILPISPGKIKETEVFAPQFKDGERVALVRFPHGGTFEIPELTVNNRNAEAARLIGRSAKDAIGIHPKVAERLSGADFDGDTVLVIPNNSGKVKSKSPLEGLKDFDPKTAYPAYEGMPKMTARQKGIEMGNVSNLITDMTIRGANDTEIARAVRHSMVVIDAEKHNLNYRLSYEKNGIASLKEKYQGRNERGQLKGASTLISRTSSDIRVPKYKPGPIDPVTGEKTRRYTGETYTKNGKVIPKTIKSVKGAEVKSAHELSSGTPVEEIYATHSDRLKTLANTARKELVSTKSIPYSPSAAKVYGQEVSSLNAKLNLALKNAPRERQAQLVANAIMKQKQDANPDMDKDDIKKASGKALTEARIRTGAHKDLVSITDREWEAIQAGAISNHKLEQILNNSNLERVKELATPRKPTVMTSDKVARANSLLASGRTPSEVAEILGVALSTLNSSLNRKD